MSSRIVIVEPSPFRRSEIYVLGPYGRIRTFLVALWTAQNHLFSEVQVVSTKAMVMLGEKILYNRKKN